MADEELAAKLKTQGVVKVRSIQPQRRLKVLHLNSVKIPKTIMIGLIKVRTEKYYPMPKICRRCMQIGHITEACEGGPHSDNCSGVHSQERNCKKNPFYVNCGNGHRPLDKICPLYSQERAIIKLQIDESVAPNKARATYKLRNKGKYIPLPNDRVANEGSTSESDSNDEGGNDPPVPQARHVGPPTETGAESPKTDNEDPEQPTAVAAEDKETEESPPRGRTRKPRPDPRSKPEPAADSSEDEPLSRLKPPVNPKPPADQKPPAGKKTPTGQKSRRRTRTPARGSSKRKRTSRAAEEEDDDFLSAEVIEAVKRQQIELGLNPQDSDLE